MELSVMDRHCAHLRPRLPGSVAPIVVIALMASSSPSLASSTTPGFVENKGQVHDQFHEPRPDVRYLFAGEGLNVQLRADGFSYDTYRAERDERMPARSDDEVSVYPGSVFHFHRIDLRFLNASPHPELIAEGVSGDHLNFFTGITGPTGATMVRSYSSITYRNVWP
jgi:hypothetical protein